MEPRIAVLTLGVSDLERSLAFYHDGLGLPTEGIIGTEFEGGAVAFFQMSGGLILAAWPQKSLSNEAKTPLPEQTAQRFTIGHTVRTREEVDVVIEQARRAGATVQEPPQDRVWGGYSGYFQDPDGHLWEVVWNPQLIPE
jgi:uncharacterized protein